MAKRRQLFAVIGFFLAAESGLVNARAWYDSQRYSPRQSYPNEPQRPGSIDIVRGTIDQLNQIDAKWVCTNPKTGDQMIFGTEIENGNTANNNAYLQQYSATSNSVPWRFQQPNDLQKQVPTYNPSPTRYPQIPVAGKNEAPLSSKPLTVEQVRKKFDNWDWTQYVTTERMNDVAYDGMSTIAYGPARMTSFIPSTTIGYDGQGVIEPRNFDTHEQRNPSKY